MRRENSGIRFFAIICGLFVLVMNCVGCGNIMNKTVDQGSVEATENNESMQKLIGWWVGKLSDDVAREYGIRGRVFFEFKEDGTVDYYFEGRNGDYYTRLNIVEIGEDEITVEAQEEGVKSDATGSNVVHFYFTADSDGNDILMSKDLATNKDGGVDIPFTKTDESVKEGKTYIYLKENVE